MRHQRAWTSRRFSASLTPNRMPRTAPADAALRQHGPLAVRPGLTAHLRARVYGPSSSHSRNVGASPSAIAPADRCVWRGPGVYLCSVVDNVSSGCLPDKRPAAPCRCAGA